MARPAHTPMVERGDVLTAERAGPPIPGRAATSSAAG